MKIVLSEHARNQMLERNISKREIISTIINPDKIIKQTQNKFQAVRLIKKNGKEYLIVVIYRLSNSAQKVITAFLTTKIKKYLK
jgi:hypothetical protein